MNRPTPFSRRQCDLERSRIVYLSTELFAKLQAFKARIGGYARLKRSESTDASTSSPLLFLTFRNILLASPPIAKVRSIRRVSLGRIFNLFTVYILHFFVSLVLIYKIIAPQPRSSTCWSLISGEMMS